MGYDQLRQTTKSIDAFRKADITCETYVLVHNRDSRNRKFNEIIKNKLRQLVSEGRASKAFLWDRQTLLRKTFERMKVLVDGSLRERCEKLLSYSTNLFDFGGCYVSEVPTRVGALEFKRGEPCRLIAGTTTEEREISQVLVSDKDTRWTLLVGAAGTGKTTSVLAMALNSNRNVIYVPCASLPSGFPVTSTNTLLEEASKYLGIADMFEDNDRDVVTEICGPVLGNLLKQPGSSYVLILDGLDENSYFSRLEGLQKLSNQLADLECPIILTTRIEHLHAMFGDFSLAFDEFSNKRGPLRKGKLLELASWGKKQILALLDHAVKKASGDAKDRLSLFKRMVINSQYETIYGELPSNPLFMHFILEDIAREGITPSNRASLLFRWAKRKIRRDRSVTTRPTLGRDMDVEDFADRMLYLTENVAGKMVIESEGGYALVETINAEFIKAEAERFFGDSIRNILPILLNSTLMPAEQRQGVILRVRFSFRIFQEYMLASYIVREKTSFEQYPIAVKEMIHDIADDLMARPDSTLANHLKGYTGVGNPYS
ncbi:hypothetical protein J7J84_03560 [bacterium]|nr:hypothetical protein [bacterium]